MTDKALITAAANQLKEANPSQGILVGFDGFVDEIIHLVSERQSATSFTRLEQMGIFAQRISDSAGKSCNIELLSIQTKLGGNGPILANTLVAQGFNVDYVGAIGANEIHPVFSDFATQCRHVVSIADPAHTHALEFFDGKVMMGKMETLNHVTWDAIIAKVGRDAFKQRLAQVELVACVNWTMLPFLNTIFHGLTSLLAELDERKLVFIDLADPRKRTASDLLTVLHLFTTMQASADVVLGLNEEESVQVSEVLDIFISDDLEKRARAIREKLGLHLVVIHPLKGAAVAFEGGSAWLSGPYASRPKLTTGAGDNFNAGFCNGLLSGLSPQQALASGVCTSGFYVRSARSPKRSELIEFMNRWVDMDLGEV